MMARQRERIAEHAETIRKPVRSMRFTPQEAMAFLDIPPEEQAA